MLHKSITAFVLTGLRQVDFFQEIILEQLIRGVIRVKQLAHEGNVHSRFEG